MCFKNLQIFLISNSVNIRNYFLHLSFNKKPRKIILPRPFSFFLVPGTGFEPAQPYGCCDLNTVRLPISPPGLNNNIKTF